MSFFDLLAELADWLNSSSLPAIADSISHNSISLLFQENFWAIPTLQSLHILCIAALFASAVVVNMRAMGVMMTHRTPAQVVQRFGPWIRWGLVGLIVTGGVLVIGEPARELLNPIFWLKMMTLVVAAVISLAFNRRMAGLTTVGAEAGGGMKGAAILIIVLWCLVILGGRWIGYSPV